MMSFETKVALLVRDDLLAWQALNVAAFLATGIAGAAPEALGAPYEDAAGRRYVPLLGQPIMIYAAAQGDDANRAAFRAEPAESPDLAGLALRGPRPDVDRATKGLRLHP